MAWVASSANLFNGQNAKENYLKIESEAMNFAEKGVDFRCKNVTDFGTEPVVSNPHLENLVDPN